MAHDENRETTVLKRSSAVPKKTSLQRTSPDFGRHLRILAIVLIALAFSVTAYVLIRRNLHSQKSGIHTAHDTVSTQEADITGIAGYYTLRAYSLNGQNTGGDADQQWYLFFKDDTSGFASLSDAGPIAFVRVQDTLRFEDGTSLRFRFSDDTITLYSSAELIFARAEAEAQELITHSQETDTPASTDSKWYGVLEISNHAGKGSLRNGRREVWGILGTAGDSRQYFELYDVKDYTAADIPVLSLWVRQEGDTYVPLIGTENAWFFDLWLTEDDSDSLALYTANDSIVGSYHYVLGKERCDIHFSVTPER